VREKFDKVRHLQRRKIEERVKKGKFHKGSVFEIEGVKIETQVQEPNGE